MKATRQVGSSSEYKHYLKIKKDIALGLVPESLVEGFKDMEKLYEHVNYIPPSFLSTAWATYWEIRGTKSIDNPVNHLDILAYQQVMRIQLLPSEVKTIFWWDTIYYKYYNKFSR